MSVNFRWNILKVVILSALFGFLSGILGGLIIAGIYAPVYGLKEEIARVPILRKGVSTDAEVASRMRSALVTFYANRYTGVPTAEDRVGYGALFTADGWIVTSQKVLRPGLSKLIAVTEDRTVHLIERAVPDAATNVVFIKIKGERMSALGTAAANDLSNEAVVSTIDSSGRIYKLRFFGILYPDGEESNVQSSEKLNKAAFVASPDGINMLGAPLVNGSGELVGILDDPALGKAIPFEYISSVFRELLRSGMVLRPYLGLSYRDLSASLYKRKEAERGALIAGTGGSKGVLRKSPASAAGLADGDIIWRVGDQEISSKLSLSEAVMQYPSGAAIRFFVRHSNGMEETKDIILGAK